MEIIDRLEVKIIEAIDLILIDNLFPSPYVEVILGPDVKRTKPIAETNEPYWNHPTMIFTQVLGKFLIFLIFLIVKSSFLNLSIPIASGIDAIMLNIKHWDMYTGKDSNLGQF